MKIKIGKTDADYETPTSFIGVNSVDITTKEVFLEIRVPYNTSFQKYLNEELFDYRVKNYGDVAWFYVEMKSNFKLSI